MKPKKKNYRQGYNPAKERLIDKAVEAGMENDPMLRKNINAFLLEDGYDHDLFRALDHRVNKRSTRYKLEGKSPNPFRYEVGQNVYGPLEFGQVVYDFSVPPQNAPIFGLYPIELCVPTLIAGSTGSGKTNILYVLASEIHRFNQTFGLKNDDRIGMFFFQTMKLDEDYLYNINDEIIFLNSSTLKINPLWHEGHNKEIVFQRFIKLAGEVFFFREGSANQISQILEQKDKENNGNPFSIYELYEGIKKLPKTRYEGVLENRIAGLLSNKSASIFSCIKGLPFEIIAHDFVIINLTDLDFYSQQFIAIYIYQYLTEYFMDKR